MLALALLLQVASVQGAPVKVADARAADAVDLFMTKCAMQMGSVALGHQLDQDPAHARPMTTEEVGQVAPPLPGAVGWIVHGDHDGWMAITYEPAIHACMVNVRAADQQTIEAALSTAVVQVYTGLFKIKKIEAKPVERTVVDGITRDTLAWEISLPGRRHFAIIATMASAPFNGRQHLMTFAIVK